MPYYPKNTGGTGGSGGVSQSSALLECGNAETPDTNEDIDLVIDFGAGGAEEVQ